MSHVRFYGIGMMIVVSTTAASAQQRSTDEPVARPATPNESAAAADTSGWSSPPPSGANVPAAQPTPQDPATSPAYSGSSPTPVNNVNYGATNPPPSNYNGGFNNSQQSNPNQPTAFNRNDAADAENPESSKLEWPTMSVRIDPLNWLLLGRLGVEIESQVWKFISVEVVPIFVVNDQPPFLTTNLSGVPNNLYQSSAGLGAVAGASLGVGFWFNGKPMEGYVLRAELTDYVYNYDSRDATGSIDHVKYLDRQFQVLIGSHSKWGPVTLAGTFGLGTMLNRQNRCFTGTTAASAATSGCVNNKELSVATGRDVSDQRNVVNLHDWTYPISLVMRISLGVVF